MKPRKIPMRSCIITREKHPKQELIRIVRTNDNKVVIDLKGKQNGRGAYLKKDLDVIMIAKRSKQLDKHLEVEIPNSIYEELEQLVKE